MTQVTHYPDATRDELLEERSRLASKLAYSGADALYRQSVRRQQLDYLGERTGTYEFRCNRYRIVATQLLDHGLGDQDLLVDVGAGWTEFDLYLRRNELVLPQGWCGRYLPVDGALDGTDLDAWLPNFEAEFFVAIEVLEHLADPWPMIHSFGCLATKASVITTPNPDVVDVLGIDRTHKTPLPLDYWDSIGWKTFTTSCFGKEHDTIVAVAA